MKPKTSMMLLLLVLTAPLGAQDERIGRKDLMALLELEFSPLELVEFLESRRATLDLSAADLAALQAAKAPDLVCDWIRKHLDELQTPSVDVKSLIAAWKESQSEEDLQKRVDAARDLPRPSAAEVLELEKAGVPRGIIKTLREGKKRDAAARKSLDKEDIVRFSRLGMPPAELIAKIRETDSRFDVTAEDFVALRNVGVAIDVLREINARRIDSRPKPAPETTPVAAAEAPMGAATEDPAPATLPTEKGSPVDLQVIRDRGLGLTMLKPSPLIENRQYQGTKALIQMVDGASDDPKQLPEVELSVLAVLAAPSEREKLSPARLGTIAERFMADLRQGFSTDGIEIAGGQPMATWISGRSAVRIEATATTSQGKSHLSAHMVFFADGRIFVASYSVASELAPHWRPLLETCLQSLSLESEASSEPIRAAGAEAEELKQLFGRWRDAVRSRDFTAWRNLHAVKIDDARTRRGFLELSNALIGDERRIEVRRIDPAEKSIEYNVFTLDGRDEARLDVEKSDGAWYLKPR